MIRGDLYPAAHQAVHRLILEARLWAYEDVPQSQIARLLDETEYLIGMLYQPRESTDDFSRYLEGVADEFGWRGIFEEFAACECAGESVASDARSN